LKVDGCSWRNDLTPAPLLGGEGKAQSPYRIMEVSPLRGDLEGLGWLNVVRDLE